MLCSMRDFGSQTEIEPCSAAMEAGSLNLWNHQGQTADPEARVPAVLNCPLTSDCLFSH